MKIAAKQGHTEAMTCLREACRHGKLDKNKFLDIARTQHDMVKETESYERTWAKERQVAVNASARTCAKEELAAADAPATSKPKKHVKSKPKKR